ncbi:MAG: hypothetical protein KGP01_04280 [Actinomycetales bacterium]|nr:hypothetical protein [Actinomycetales bacterium]
MSEDPKDSAASASESHAAGDASAAGIDAAASGAAPSESAAANSVSGATGEASTAQPAGAPADPATPTRRRFTRRARLIALATAGAVVISGGAASWAIYNKPELRLVRAIKATSAQKNMDVNLSFQATPAFLRAMNQGKPLFQASDAPLAGIKTDADVAQAIGNIHLRVRSSSTDIKDPSVMVALQYGSADALAVTLTGRRLYIRTQAEDLPGQSPALFTAAQFKQVLDGLKQPLGPEFADYINADQRAVLTKLIDFVQGRTLFLSLAKGTDLGKWWDSTVVAQTSSKDPSASAVQKQMAALGTRMQGQLRDVAKVKDLADDAAGDRMRITIDIATLVRLNKTQILDLAQSLSGLGGSGADFDRAAAIQELNAWLAKPTLATFSADVWVKNGRFHRFEFDMSDVIAASMAKKPKVERGAAVVRMDMDDIPVTAPADATEFTPADIQNAGGLLGGLFMGGLAQGLGGSGL